ncbi:MAG: heavy-metal-associated domain-containing protein [Gammaproteobacteria bacterium]|nr:heavy-metal-associated domain-containing protein [Gammaproteobacteria bacterium]
MSHYIHHVPGRLRVRSKAFRCNQGIVEGVERELRALEGVQAVRHNHRNGSLTVQYDAATDAGRRLFEVLANAGCIAVAEARHQGGEGMAAAFGRAMVSALAQQTVARSFSTLAAVLR